MNEIVQMASGVEIVQARRLEITVRVDDETGCVVIEDDADDAIYVGPENLGALIAALSALLAKVKE